MIHHLDIQDRYFKDIENGIKTFEIRRDRDFNVGDTLILKNIKSKQTIKRKIKYINDLSVYKIKHIFVLGI